MGSLITSKASKTTRSRPRCGQWPPASDCRATGCCGRPGLAGVSFGAGRGLGLALGFQDQCGVPLGLGRGGDDQAAVVAEGLEPARDVGGRVVAQARHGDGPGAGADHGAADLRGQFLAGVAAGAVVVEGGDAGPVQPVRGAGGVGGLAERGGVAGLAAGELARRGQRDLVAGGVVAGAGADGVYQGGPAGGEVSVEHDLIPASPPGNRAGSGPAQVGR